MMDWKLQMNLIHFSLNQLRNWQLISDQFDDIQRDLSTSFHIKEVNQSEICNVIKELRQSKAKD
jgi:hypothetical protein